MTCDYCVSFPSTVALFLQLILKFGLICHFRFVLRFAVPTCYKYEESKVVELDRKHKYEE